MAQRKQPSNIQRPDAATLRRQYHDDGIQSSVLAMMYAVAPQTILNWMKRYGIERRPVSSCPGKTNPAWKGGKILDKHGYVLVLANGHPNARKNGRILEHRLVMSEMLCRPLLDSEVVHHKDGNRQNNHPSNLVLYSSNANHLREELTGNVPNWSPEGKSRIDKANQMKKPAQWSDEMREAQRMRLAERRANGERFCASWTQEQRDAARQRMIKRMQAKKLSPHQSQHDQPSPTLCDLKKADDQV